MVLPNPIYKEFVFSEVSSKPYDLFQVTVMMMTLQHAAVAQALGLEEAEAVVVLVVVVTWMK